MTATTLQLDDELAIQENPWRGRLITAGVLLALLLAGAVAAYFFFFRDGAENTRATEDIEVKRATISANLIIAGIAETALNSDLVFQTAGRVASVNVKVGDVVTQDQVLASLESEDLANSVEIARTSLLTAQLKLDDLLAGSTDAELAAATQAVASAEAALVKARNDYEDLQDGATAAELAAAEQAVQLAQSQLATALSARQKLEDAPSDADLAAAEAAVASAQAALTAAQNSATNADNTVSSAAAALKSAETSYCAADAAPAFCATPATPISSGDAALLDAALSGANAALASAVITSNTTYLNAVNSAASADASVASAEDALASAEARLDAVEAGPSDEEFDATDAAVASAEAALAAAEEKRADLEAGPSALQLETAAAAVESAEAALTSARARQDEAIRGPEQNAIEQARKAVASAQLTVEAAQIRVKNAQISAPFDGTVAAVNITQGEFFSLASTTPAIVLLTPDRVQLDINVGETDYPGLKLNQGGVVIFDSLPGKPYPFTITEIGLSPTVTQGVVTYKIKASLVVLPGNPQPAPGMNARGQITIEQRPNVLAIPPRAIRRRGADQVVDVRRGGTVEEVVITTGLTDSESVEVLTGLSEGDVLVVPSLTRTEGGRPSALQTPLPGNIR